MSNILFPGQHTTTTTITASETQVNPTVRFDRQYLYTIGGQFKLAEIISSFIALLFVSFSIYAHHSNCTFFQTVAIAAIWWNTILLVFYIFHVIEKFYKIPWLTLEIITCVVFSALYFLAALLSLTYLFLNFIFFFFLTFASCALMAIFGYDAYIKLQAYQNGEIAQGVRVVSHVTETEPPTYRY